VVIVGEEEDEPRRAHHGDAMDEGDGVSLGSVQSEAQGDAVRGCGRAGRRGPGDWATGVAFCLCQCTFLGPGSSEDDDQSDGEDGETNGTCGSVGRR
jgi:hypothetical protein